MSKSSSSLSGGRRACPRPRNSSSASTSRTELIRIWFGRGANGGVRSALGYHRARAAPDELQTGKDRYRRNHEFQFSPRHSLREQTADQNTRNTAGKNLQQDVRIDRAE